MREIFGIKLKEEGENGLKVVIFNMFVRGTKEEVDSFVKLAYGKIGEKVEIRQLSTDLKYHFPWEITHQIVDLQPIFAEDDSTYLIRLGEGFSMGTISELKKYPILAFNSLKVRLTDKEVEGLKRIHKPNKINKNWYTFENKHKYRKLKKFWNKKVMIK